MSSAPFPARYAGEGAWEGIGRWQQELDKHFTVGQVYRLAQVHDRSTKSHNQFFAIVEEAWGNLPPHLHQAFPTDKALRKWALCMAGYCKTTQYDCGSAAAAQRFAATFRDHFDAIEVTGNTVTTKRAHSQAYARMDRKSFQEAKDLCIGILAGMIGVTPEELTRETGKAA